MALGGTRLNPPEDDTEFERLCVPLWRGILDDPNVKRMGRNGQAQFGLDLYGIRNGDAGHVVGIQCKWKGQGKKLDPKKDVRDEVKKARGFRPALREYHIVTTAEDSTDMDQLAATISQELAAENVPMTVHIWGWGHLGQEIRRFPDAMRAVDPGHSAFADEYLHGQTQLLEEAKETKKLVLELSSKVATKDDVALGPPSDAAGSRNVLDDILDREIDAAREVLLSGDAEAALETFQRMEAGLPAVGWDRIRFRLKANIGLCHHDRGEAVAASTSFEEAFAALPDDPKAIAFRAFGLLLNGDWAALRDFAEPQLEADPTNLSLAGYLVQGAQLDSGIGDPFSLVPEELRSSVEIRVAVAHTLQRRGDVSWRDLAHEVAAQEPDNLDAVRLAADASFDEVIESRLPCGGRLLDADQIAKLEDARGGYSKLWAGLADRVSSPGPYHSSLAANYINVLRLMDDPEAAVQVARTAVEYFKDDGDLQIRIAAAAAEASEWQLFDAVAPHLPAGPDTVMIRFDVLLQRKLWAGLAALLAEHMEEVPKSEADLARSAQMLAEVATSDKAADADAILKIVESCSSSVRGSAIVSAYASEQGCSDAAAAAYANAVTLGKASDVPAERVTVAFRADARGDWSTVIDMLDGIIPEHRPSHLLSMLARAHVNCDPIRKRSKAFFERLAGSVAETRFMLQTHGVFLMQLGEYEAAKAHLMRAWEKERALDILHPLVRVMWQLDEQEEVLAFVGGLDVDAIPGSPGQRMELAHLLMMLDRPEDAYRIGYDTLRAAHDEADVVLKYMGLFLAKTVTEDPLEQVGGFGQVVSGAWIQLSSSNGQSLEGIVEGTEPVPWGDPLETSNSLVRSAMDLRKGDSFERADPILDGQTWTVAEIKNPRLQAFHFFINEFNARFPDSTGLGSIQMQDGDVSPVLEMIEKRGRREEEICRLYSSSYMPLGLFAHVRGSTPLEFAKMVAAHGFQVKTCRGLLGERTDALEELEANRGSGAVLDLLTAWNAAEMGILGVLKEIFGTLLFPHSAWRALKVLEEEKTAFGSGESMSMGWSQGKYYREVYSPSERAENARQLSRLVSDIESACDIRTVVVPDDPGDIADALLEWAPDFLDAALLAADDHMLLSEDRHYREMSSVVAGCRGVWLQVVLMSAVEQGIMSASRYRDAMMGLAHRRHGHLAVSSEDLRHALANDPTPGLVVFEAMASFMGGDLAELRSNINVASEFLSSIWARSQNKPPTAEQRSRGTDIVLSTLLMGRTGLELARWHYGLCQSVPERLLKVIERFIKNKVDLDSLHAGYDEMRSQQKEGSKRFRLRR